jgi:hypothetical protein
MQKINIKETDSLKHPFLKCIYGFLLFLLINLNSYGIGNNIIITEFLTVNNSIISDSDGDYNDWIEVYNTSAESVNLKDWVLTDKESNLEKWKFPDINLLPNEYLIVFASGKNLITDKKNLHTSFKLSSGGEYLAIVDPDGTISNHFSPTYPIQYPDVSYGIINEKPTYFNTPTPGNQNIADPYLLPPDFSVTHGFFTNSFDLEISSPAAEATIKYTLDGSEPNITHGSAYTSPFSINSTTVVRAIVFAEEKKSLCITTSYIFIDDIINQTNTPAGYPAEWGSYSNSNDNAIADYEMDSEITNTSNEVTNSLRAIPTLSIVTDKNNLFSAEDNETTGGIYLYTTDDDWERPASAEYFGNNDPEGFQVNCGIKIQGGQSRLPEKSPKHSIRLLFKEEYGPNKLKYNLFTDKSATNEFNGIVLRAGYNNTWFHFDNEQRERAQYIRDSWAKDTYLYMGCIATYNKFVHLYLNGIYWGLYNISERIDEDFMESYLGGDKLDYDVIKDKNAVSGNSISWNQMMNYVSEGFPDNASYQFIQGKNEDGSENPSYKKYLDVENLIDYMILNFYGGNLDWDHHNWLAARNKVETAYGFQFFPWDTERILEDLDENIITVINNNCPSEIFQQLAKNTEFKLKFADRVQQHFFNNGALTAKIAAENWMLRANEIADAVIAESARWGDYRRDIHQWMNGPYNLYNLEDYWLTEQDRLINEYFPYRTEIVLDQFMNKGLYPTVDSPEFSQHGGPIEEGFELEITSSQGDIYYTTDNSDPRLIGGEVSSSAQLKNTDPLIINSTTTIKTRAKYGSQWSAITEALFYDEFYTNINNDLSNISLIPGNYPNPFHDYTTISYYLPQESYVTICINTLDGKLYDKLVIGYQSDGRKEVLWKPNTSTEGMYIYTIKTSNYTVSGRMIKY